MRLVDKVVQARHTELIPIENGQNRQITAAGYFARAIAECPIRYILDRNASIQCADIFREEGDIPDASDELTRLPARNFWIEFYCDANENGAFQLGAGIRMGLLVEAEADGRSGTLECFFEKEDGTAKVLGGTVHFDFDRDIDATAEGSHTITHASLPRLATILRHAKLVLRQDWRTCAKTRSTPYASLVTEVAEYAWCALPMILCFSALLNARSALKQKPSALTKLNAARARRGRPALLEHVEISLNIGPSILRQDGQRGAASTARGMPRLHFVRGHTVVRAGSSFWRSSHFRGASSGVPITTANVTARRGISRTEHPTWPKRDGGLASTPSAMDTERRLPGASLSAS